MKDSKNSISCFNLKKKDNNIISPFQMCIQNQNQYDSSQRFTYQSNEDENSFRRCLSHSLPITNICFSCNFNLLCSNCLNESTHKNHDFRNLQKSFSYMKNNLKQYAIKLQSNFNLLTNLTQQLSKTKIDIFSEAEKYKQSVHQEFALLIEQISIKQIQIILKIDKLKEDHQKQMQKTIIQIKRHQNQNLQWQKQMKRMIQSQNQKKIHNFFNKNKENAQKIIDNKIISEFQNKIYQISWCLDFQQISIISNKLKNLVLTYKIKNINSHVSKPETNSFKKLVKYKSQTNFKPKIVKKIKVNQLQKTQKIIKNYRNEQQRDSNKSYGTFCMTPKQNCSKEKNTEKIDYLNLKKDKKTPQKTNLIKKRKKSSGKNISMPVSPVKEEKQVFLNSPVNVDAMKKKKIQKNG